MARTAPLSVAVRPAGRGVVRIGCGPDDPGPQDEDGAIRVQRGASGLAVCDADGKVLCEAGQPDGQNAWVWRMPSGTHYFGLGERTRLLEKKGGRYTFWNTDQYEHQGPDTDSLYQSIPFFLAVDESGICHGVLIDSVARSVIDLSDLHGECLRLQAEDPVLHHCPGDPQARLRDDEAMLGRDLLLAPVLRPGRVTREVYLPAGRWYGLHDRTVHNGPCTVIAAAPLDGDMPVYARTGAIIPTGPDLAHVGQKPLDPLTLHIFPDERGEAEGFLYEDDGDSNSHEDGHWAHTTFSYAAGEMTTTTTGRFPPAARNTIIKLVNGYEQEQR